MTITGLILIIDDNADIRENTAELLMLEGYRVQTAKNGVEGLTMINELMPELIICDVIMPGMNGYDLYRLIQQNEQTRHIRFIMSTAQSQREDLDKASAAGIKNYIIKPFDDVDLMRCIEGC